MIENESPTASTRPYESVQVDVRQEEGDGWAWSKKPDDLWECPDCGAVVRGRDRHDAWHEKGSCTNCEGIDPASCPWCGKASSVTGGSMGP